MQELELVADCTQQAARNGIGIIKSAMERLRLHILENPFTSETDEIYFFKKAKPRLTSKLIYLLKLYKLESCRPTGNEKAQRKLLKKELREVERYGRIHESLYQYYRTGATHLDPQYFLRDRMDLHVFPDPQLIMFDGGFCTVGDYVFAKFIAYERYGQYITTELRKLNIDEGVGGMFLSAGNRKLRWTAPKAALYELIYAVFSDGAINEGNAEIKEIASVFGEGFNIDVSQIYRAGQEMRIRNSRTKYLKRLIERVENRWNEQDENPRY